MILNIANLTPKQKRMIEQITAFFCDPAHSAELAALEARQGMLVQGDDDNIRFVKLTESGQRKIQQAIAEREAGEEAQWN